MTRPDGESGLRAQARARQIRQVVASSGRPAANRDAAVEDRATDSPPAALADQLAGLCAALPARFSQLGGSQVDEVVAVAAMELAGLRDGPEWLLAVRLRSVGRLQAAIDRSVVRPRQVRDDQPHHGDGRIR